MSDFAWIVAVVACGLFFEYVNGFHDAANSIATSVLTRALSIQAAVLMCGFLNFLGALSSTAVATTMGKGIVDPSDVTHPVIVSAFAGAILWDLITWWFGMPTSSTHAIIGGIIGAVGASGGLGLIKLAGTKKIFLGLILSPLLGICAAFFFMIALMWIFRHAAPNRLNRRFRIVQVLSASFMAFSHGSNDGQKSMGVITMALASGGLIPTFHVPIWVMFICAGAMGLGSAIGGWRIIKTIGRKVIDLQPIHGFAAETSAAAIIIVASHLGSPISTTHTISSAIMGVGMSRRMSGVRWRVVSNIVLAWCLTLPAAAILSALIAWMLRGLVGLGVRGQGSHRCSSAVHLCSSVEIRGNLSRK